MLCELDEAFWDNLLTRIHEGEVIPIVGPGAVTFGSGDELLYPSLAGRLANELKPPLQFDDPPSDLQAVVDEQRRVGQSVDRIYRHLHKIVENPDLRPGPTLDALAGIEAFKLLLTTTFDPLLIRASESAFAGGRAEERHGAITLRGASPDLPRAFHELEYPFVYQILGSAKPVRDFVVWDDDVFYFLLGLDQQLPQLPYLKEAIKERHLLVLGLSFADWLLRFFVQVIKRQRLSDLAGSELYVAENLRKTRRHRVVIFFSRLTQQIRIVPSDPRDFVAQLYQRWRMHHPAPVGDPYRMKQAHREKHRTPGCIFVSYASPDLEIARYIVSRLQKAGCLVWFDKEQLQLGEIWEEELRKAVEDRCGLFLCIISDHTAARLEGFDIFERKLAAKRRGKLADNAIFYLPVRIDDGEPLIPENEPLGTGNIQGVRKPGGHLDEDFIGYLREKQRENCAALGYPLPPDSP